ncbi:MAG TPA: hypothetical protein VHV83_10255 [Armatimonadota bacterium]|nr:hypothetical protein [Armatimonadota bacterium]
MATYYAIARRNGQWVYICSGKNPEEIYREAIDLIEAQGAYAAEDHLALSPSVESQLDTLRVVPAESAKEHYHVVYPRGLPVEQ